MTTNVSMPRAFRQADELETQAGDHASRYWRVLAVIAPILTAVLYWHISQDAVAPRTGYDEIHLLQMARLISGDDNVAQLAGSGYYPGWAVVLAPIWWFTEDATMVYAAAIALSNLIGLATIVPLAMIGRHLGLTWSQSVVAGSIVMILPSRSVMADYALSEQLLTFFFAWAVLAAFALWRRPSWWRVVLFVGTVGAAYLTQPRAIALVATAAVWLAALALRRWYLAPFGLALLVGAYLAADHFAMVIADRVLLRGYGKGVTLRNTLENFDFRIFGTVVLNQTWVQVVGTGGLFAIGCVIVIVWTIRELRGLRLGVGAFVFGFGLSTMLMSAIWWTRPDILLRDQNIRFDAWTYSRYIDPVSAIIVLIAIVALIRGLRAHVIWTSVGVFAIGSIPVVFWIGRYAPSWGQNSASNAAILPWTGILPDEPFDVPLVPSLTNDTRFWVWATLFALVSMVVLCVLRRQSRPLAGFLLALVSALALLANPSAIRPYPANVTDAIEQIEALTVGENQARVDIDLSCRTPGIANAVNWFPYWLSPRQVEIVDPREGEEFEAELVLTCEAWTRVDELGARAYAANPNYRRQLWVLPGELQDELDAAGLLRD